MAARLVRGRRDSGVWRDAPKKIQTEISLASALLRYPDRHGPGATGACWEDGHRWQRARRSKARLKRGQEDQTNLNVDKSRMGTQQCQGRGRLETPGGEA